MWKDMDKAKNLVLWVNNFYEGILRLHSCLGCRSVEFLVGTWDFSKDTLVSAFKNSCSLFSNSHSTVIDRCHWVQNFFILLDVLLPVSYQQRKEGEFKLLEAVTPLIYGCVWFSVWKSLSVLSLLSLATKSTFTFPQKRVSLSLTAVVK